LLIPRDKVRHVLCSNTAVRKRFFPGSLRDPGFAIPMCESAFCGR